MNAGSHNNMFNIKSKLAIIGLSIIATSASAVTVLDSTVQGPAGSWGFVNFYYGGGNLAIDALSSGFTQGPTGAGIGDIYLSLFQNDGSARSNFTGAAIASNDDGGYPGFGDGSTSSFDSYLNVSGLSAGNYTVAISACCNNFGGVRNENILSSGISNNRDYRLTFSQDVTLGANPKPPVPVVLEVSGTVGGPNGSWGFVDFVHNGGKLSIDALANGYTGGPTGHGIADIYLGLFANDGSPRSAFTGAFLASNDDSASPNGLRDGSTSSLDSYLNIDDLAAGRYTVAIGSCCNRFDFYRNEGMLFSGIRDQFRDYKLTFTGNVVVPSVPEPEVFGLIAVGLLVVGANARKRKGQTAAI
ncbi:MAG: hypothetical protein EOP38_25210 [Rubrivivax sp.]|nr:MAG: hypothetical protein EOP38_25210 [Rubrivivax sp.]